MLSTTLDGFYPALCGVIEQLLPNPFGKDDGLAFIVQNFACGNML